MKNKKMKIGAVMALLGCTAVATTVCVMNTQMNSKINSASESSHWQENMGKVVSGNDVKGQIDVEMYEHNGSKAIKLEKGHNASMDNGVIADTLHTMYDGDVRIETIGKEALAGVGYVRGTLKATGIVSIDEAALKGTGITQLVIKQGTIWYIGKYACADCQYLESIVIENAATSGILPEVEDNAYEGCSNLKEIRIGDGMDNQSVVAHWTNIADRISKHAGSEIKVVR